MPVGNLRDSSRSRAKSLPVVGEQPRARADDHRADDQRQLVDELVLEQPADQLPASVHLQLAARLGLQLADGRLEISGEHGRVRPLPGR